MKIVFRSRINGITERGTVMITAMFTVLLMVVTVTGLTTLVMSQGTITDLQRKSSKAMQIADAGLSHAMLVIRNESDPLGQFPIEEDYAGGSYTVTIEQPAATVFAEWYRLTSTGEIAGEANRKVQQDVFKVSFWNQGYSGAPVTSLQGNAEIIGSLYVRSNLIMDKGGAGIKRGPLYVKGNIELNNAAASIGEEEGEGWGLVPLFLDGTYTGNGNYYVDPVNNWVPKILLPEVDMTELRQMAADNNNSIYNGDLTLRNRNVSFGNFTYTAASQKKKGGADGNPVIDRIITTSGFGNLSSPVATGSDANNNVYVLERGANRVLKYSNTLEYITSWDGFNTPNGIAVDTRNRDGELTQYIYVSDTNNNVVKKYDEDGNFIGSIGLGTLNSPLGIAADESGNVFVVDSGNAVVRKYDSNGTLQWTTAAITEPRGIAVDSFGYVYVSCKTSITPSRYGVKKYSNAGTYVSQSGGSVSLGDPKNISVDDEIVYVAEKGNDRINRLTTASLSETPPGSSTFTDNFNDPEGASLDLSNNLFVSDTADNEVRIYKQQQAGLSINGVTYIEGDLTLTQDIIYALGAQGGTIVVEGDITMTAMGQRFLRPNPVTDTTEANFSLLNAIGFITPREISVQASGGDSYTQPTLVALMYGGEEVSFSGPFIFRGMFASEIVNFEQVPHIYVQKPDNMPPGIPGTDPEIYIGGWREID